VICAVAVPQHRSQDDPSALAVVDGCADAPCNSLEEIQDNQASDTGPGPAAIPFGESTHRRLEQVNTMVAGFGHCHECSGPIPTRPVTDLDRRFNATVTRPSQITILNHLPPQHASATHAADPLTVMIKDSQH
jgi:hypothetical protein